MEDRIIHLESRVRQLEQEIEELQGTMPETDIISRNFFRRALAVFGHNFIITILLIIPWTLFMAMLVSMMFQPGQYPVEF